MRKGVANEHALHRDLKTSNKRDLVEEFIACEVWSLAHGCKVGEVKLSQMPFLKNQMVLSPAIAIELHGRDAVGFVREGGCRGSENSWDVFDKDIYVEELRHMGFE